MDRSNISLVGNTTIGTNLGGGTGVYKDKNGGNVLQFKTISGGTGISISTTATMINICSTASGGGGITGATSLAGGCGIYTSVASCNLKFKSLVAGNGVVLSATTNNIMICDCNWTRAAAYICPICQTDSVQMGNSTYICWKNGPVMRGSTGGTSSSWCVATSNGQISIGVAGFITSQSDAGFTVANSAFTCYTQLTYDGQLISTCGNLNMNPKNKNDGTKACHIEMCGGANSCTGLGGDIIICGGNSTLGAGGNVCLDVSNSAGTTKGQLFLCGLTGNTSETCVVYINAAGRLTTGSVIPPSDCRLKSNISAISIAPINVEYKQFNFCNTPNKISVGVIAQELCLTHPNFVSVDDKGYLSVNYSELHSLEIAYLKCRICELEKKLDNIIVK